MFNWHNLSEQKPPTKDSLVHRVGLFFSRSVRALSPPTSLSTFRLFEALHKENLLLLPESEKFGGLLGYTVNIELGFV